MSTSTRLLLPALLVTAVALGACGHRKQKAAAGDTTTGAATAAPAAPAAKPAKPAKAPKPDPVRTDTAIADTTAPDPATVQRVEDDGKVGEVRGTPAADSRFTQLKMGMTMKQVQKLLGVPSDKHAYITGKGFYFAWSDTMRHEFIYEGQGRLTFSSSGALSLEAKLIRIIHNANEPAKRS